MSGHVDVLWVLVQANKAQRRDDTPAYSAARDGHADAVQVLAQATADVCKATAADGTKPTATAAQNGHTDTLMRLLLLPKGGATGCASRLVGGNPDGNA